jgi:hypothetical protein
MHSLSSFEAGYWSKTARAVGAAIGLGFFTLLLGVRHLACWDERRDQWLGYRISYTFIYN